MDMFNNDPTVLKERTPERRIRRALAILALSAASLAALASCASAPVSGAGGLTDPAADGRRFASLRCASCHAMDRDELGSNPNAPPMKRLLPRLEFKMLERSPSQETDLVHGAMPPLRLSLSDKQSLVAYLESISE